MQQVDLSLIRQFQQAVLVWYQEVGRDLPWRKTDDPYLILVSEVMLQQTQVLRVIEKYQNWLRLFPEAVDLAKASPATAITAWSGLGYNRRALYLQRTAQTVVALGKFPNNYADLLKLPGVGPYTAAAVCSFAYNQDIALVDTNIKRIYQLLVFGDQTEPKDKEVLLIAENFLPKNQSRKWHNALMDLGTVLAQERGAKAQQQKLRELFPVLKQYDLPLVSDQPLKRPKQSRFTGSARYYRGQIVKLLQSHPQLTIDEVKKSLTLPDDASYTYEQIIETLVKDGLICFDKEKIWLPR